MGESRPWQALAVATACLACVVLAGCSGSTTATVVLPTATNGDLRLATDRSHYGVSDPIGVTVSNVSTNAYYAVTGRSACTFLQFQLWDSATRQWVMVSPCNTNQPAQSLLIRAGMQEPFSLAPTSGANPNTWQPGAYRIALSYSTNADGTTGAQVAYSAGFTIS